MVIWGWEIKDKRSMDVITTAIISALAGLSKDAVKDSYNAIKAALKEKFGAKSELMEAIDKLEKKPDSKGRQEVLQEEVEEAKVNDDTEIVQLAQELLDKLKDQPGKQVVITQTVSHVKYAATSATGKASIGKVTEHQASKDN